MTLILLPNHLGNAETADQLLPAAVAAAAARLDGLIAESEAAGRRFLSRYETKKPAREIPIALLNVHTRRDELPFLLEPVAEETWGLISDGGMPCIADPGSRLVRLARSKGIAIEAIPGPSSILLSLLLTGLSGQSFAFHGYISRDREEHIQKLEERSVEDNATQLVIETPYRNQHTLEALVAQLQPETLLGIACDLTLPTQQVIVHTVAHWRRQELPDIRKRPTVFLLATPRVRTEQTSRPAPRDRRRTPVTRGRRSRPPRGS